ncbi:hypothetical protein [Pseudomonas sp. TSRC2-2]|uniref:hypothetical protein n=1 Tax=Pseudomonas sp. TSRC2-2 TaxID=2804571 RepID=UPI003CF87CF6
MGNNQPDGNGTQVTIIEGMFVMSHLNNDLRADFVEALKVLEDAIHEVKKFTHLKVSFGSNTVTPT